MKSIESTRMKNAHPARFEPVSSTCYTDVIGGNLRTFSNFHYVKVEFLECYFQGSAFKLVVEVVVMLVIICFK